MLRISLPLAKPTTGESLVFGLCSHSHTSESSVIDSTASSEVVHATTSRLGTCNAFWFANEIRMMLAGSPSGPMHRLSLPGSPKSISKSASSVHVAVNVERSFNNVKFILFTLSIICVKAIIELNPPTDKVSPLTAIMIVNPLASASPTDGTRSSSHMHSVVDLIGQPI